MRQAFSEIQKDTKSFFTSLSLYQEIPGDLCGGVPEFRISSVGRRLRNSAQGSWRNKLYPVFFELARLNQDFEKRWAQLQNECQLEIAAPNVGPKVQKEIFARFLRAKGRLEKWFEAELVGINRRYTPVRYNPLAYSYFTLDPPISDSDGLREYLHFHRHGESRRVTAMKDAQGDIKAWDKIARTERDFRILAFGRGAIAPFQEDVIHRQLLQLVICYERERLTTEELAECFDKYCACGKENHETDALRKMRDRFEAEVRAE